MGRNARGVFSLFLLSDCMLHRKERSVEHEDSHAAKRDLSDLIRVIVTLVTLESPRKHWSVCKKSVFSDAFLSSEENWSECSEGLDGTTSSS